MDVESKSPGSRKPSKTKTKRNVCFVVLAVIVAVILLFVILGLTVFKPKRPVTSVNSTSLDDFNIALDFARLRVNVNLTLDVNLSIKNPNKVGFRYANSSALLRYRGEVVGEAPIHAGKIGADKTTQMNLKLTILADRLISNANLYSDFISGTIPITAFTRISGKVHILMFNIHVVSYTTCDMNLSVADRNISSQICHYKTKL